MENVIIRQAKYSDIDSIMAFIKEYWSNEHILANNRKMFEYQYVIDRTVNFILGVGEETGKIYGIVGYIPCNSIENHDKWGSLWKTIKSSNPLLGIDIDDFLSTLGNMSGLGISSMCREISIKRNKNSVVELKHAYRLSNKEEYLIASIENNHIEKTQPQMVDFWKVETLDELEEVFDIESMKEIRYPYKDAWYLNRRYFQHPYYDYRVYCIGDNREKAELFLVAREQECKGRKVLRIVDCIGDEAYLEKISYDLDQLISTFNYEYIDFYYYGINDTIIKKAGFNIKEENDENIIPNYFEPFVKENIGLEANIFDYGRKNYVFKADSDQDRPNKVG